MNSYAQLVKTRIIENSASLPQYIEEGDAGELLLRIPHPRIPGGLVLSTYGDDITVGFRTWHTHGDILEGPGDDIERTLRFPGQILDNKAQIAISYVDDAFHDAWITDDPARERQYVQPNECIVVGTWEELAS